MTDNCWIQFDGKTYAVQSGQTALDAMLRGSANLVFSCRKGTCRSCMLEAVSGDPGEEGQARLPQKLRDLGFFLPCVTRAPDSVVARRPDMSKWVARGVLEKRQRLADDLFLIRLTPGPGVDWRAGQYISVGNPQGQFRSYSLASHFDDGFMDLHVRHYPDGHVSDWLVRGIDVGDTVEFHGPTGTCYYSTEMADRDIVLVATGSGGGMAMAVAADALGRDHDRRVHLYHGASRQDGLYLVDALAKMADRHPNFTATCLASRDGAERRVADAMLADHADLSGAAVYVCGNPDMVESVRIGAMKNGADLRFVFSDPFEMPAPYVPKDKDKIAGFAPDAQMWAALQNGKLLTDILTEFYTRAFADTRLAPFFHKVTKRRLIEKQYAFTRDLLTGTADYFGELPFNSHHWMIISDELFDYREHLFFDVVRRFGVDEVFVRRWAALNETFRREIVKSQMRGQILDGVERYKEKFVDELIEVDTVCDGCGGEIQAGARARLHARTGELYCAGCQTGEARDRGGNCEHIRS